MKYSLYKEKEWNYYLITIPIMLFLIVFFTWTTISEVDEVVKGDGNVIPSGQTQMIQHLEGGIISKINVREGDEVKKGDTIYTINNANFQSDFKKNELELLAKEAKRVRLNDTLALKQNISFPKELLEKIPQIVENEKAIFVAEKKKFFEEVEILEQKKSQKESKRQEAGNRLKNLAIELKLAREGLRMLESLYKKGAASKREYITELTKKQELVTQITTVKDSIPTIDKQIKEAEQKIELSKSEYRSKALQELNKVQVEINKLQEEIRANEDREIREAITSPVKGIVKKLYFYTEGGIVKAGDKVAEITPIDDSLTIEAKIKTSDRAQVWVGQKVSIEITAYDFSKYGLLEGELIHISPDSFYDRKGNSFYIVKVKTENFQFAPDLPILPGMVANISILTGSKTILEYILKPLKDITQNSLTEK